MLERNGATKDSTDATDEAYKRKLHQMHQWNFFQIKKSRIFFRITIHKLPVVFKPLEDKDSGPVEVPIEVFSNAATITSSIKLKKI